MANYLEIVNDAIAEAKVSLDPLTSANFSAPPRTVLYNHFKRWVNMAYTELYMKRPEWEFRKERAVVEIWPRLHLAGLTYTPSVSHVFTCGSSGVVFTVKEVLTFEDVEVDTALEVTVGVEFSTTSDPTNIIIKETVTSTGGTGYIKGYGRYNFTNTIVDTVDLMNVSISYPPSVASTMGNEVYPLTYLPRSEWKAAWIEYPWTSGYARPYYITETSDGNFDLYPKPDRSYILSYEFNRPITKLDLWDDIPATLPAKYHNYLVWRAVQEYGDWNKDSATFLRAKKHADEYLSWIDRDKTQMPSIGPSKFRV